MRRIVSTLALVAALLVVTLQPVAGAPPVREGGTSLSAIGSTSVEADGSLVFMGIELYTDGIQGQVHVSRATYAVHGDRMRLLAEEYGTVLIDASLLTVGDDLSVLVLPTVMADLWDCDEDGCTPTETVAVAVTFTATGPLTTAKERGTYRSEWCTYRYAATYEDRPAVMDLLFDGVESSYLEAGIHRETTSVQIRGCAA